MGTNTPQGPTTARRTSRFTDMAFFPKFFKIRGTVKARLLNSSATGWESAEFLSDLSAYTATGTNVSDVTVSGTNTVNGAVVSYDPGTVSWTTVTCSDVGYAILYVDTGSASTSAVIGYADLRNNGAARVVVNASLNVTWPTSGIRVHVW